MRYSGGERVRWALGCAGACCALGCGGEDDEPDKPDCGTVGNPDLFTITNVEPAVGASVPNAQIVHRFKIVGSLVVNMTQAALTSAHTAGEPAPAPTWAYLTESDGASYTASAVTWATAPGHVEIEFAGAYLAPDDCVWAFPAPLFSYDITAP